MSKLIAVWGSPNSGKTTLAVKLALHIYSKCKAMVTVVSADDRSPALPVIFPNKKADEMFSIGVPLSKPEITHYELLKNIVTVKGKSNLGFLGYIDGENRFTYPAYDNFKAESMYKVLKSIADIVIVDCTSDIQNTLTVTALKNANAVLRIANPELKSVSFFASQLPLLSDPIYKRDQHIICINSTDNTIYEPVNESVSHFKGADFLFPFSKEIKNQYATGALTENLKDKKFNAVLEKLAEEVV